MPFPTKARDTIYLKPRRLEVNIQVLSYSQETRPHITDKLGFLKLTPGDKNYFFKTQFITSSQAVLPEALVL